jgi:hypothetical protein
MLKQVLVLFPKSYLWQESLNSDGKQLHQYQQNKQPPFISNHWTFKDHDECRWKLVLLETLNLVSIYSGWSLEETITET